MKGGKESKGERKGMIRIVRKSWSALPSRGDFLAGTAVVVVRVGLEAALDVFLETPKGDLDKK